MSFLKSLKKEFESVRQDLTKMIQPGGQGQGHQQHGYGQNQQGYGENQHGASYPGQQSGYPGQQQQGSYGQPQQHQSQYQIPGQPPPPQWQQHNQQYPPPPGQHRPSYQVQPPQQQQSYPAQPQQQYPGSSSTQKQQSYPAQPPQQYPGSASTQQQHFAPPPVPYGSHASSPQPPPVYGSHSGTPQPPPANLSQQHNLQPQKPIGQPGVYYRFNFAPTAPVSASFDQKLGNNNGWGNAELQNYTSQPQNSFYTPDHKLVLRAISQNSQFTSARLVSRQTLSRPRGCLTAYLTSPCASGIWPAFWLLPSEPFSWPNDGEVDIAETWNGDCQNHTCLHWGFYTPQDAWKHRVIGTAVPDMAQRAVKYEFAWDQNEANGQGRMVWWIDSRPIMKAPIPEGVRQLRDFQVIINIAMGGNVCQGQRPRDGAYDFVVHEISMRDEPEGGWGRFEHSWQGVREGNTM